MFPVSDSPYFNPQAPCGARRSRCRTTWPPSGFQSTGPLRGPTLTMYAITTASRNFNPQAPCGARRFPAGPARWRKLLQSTGPLRGPTSWVDKVLAAAQISIHRPLAGPDSTQCQSIMLQHISIHRPLAGPDSYSRSASFGQSQFQSTGPLRGPTKKMLELLHSAIFQSTGPLRGPTLPDGWTS